MPTFLRGPCSGVSNQGIGGGKEAIWGVGGGAQGGSPSGESIISSSSSSSNSMRRCRRGPMSIVWDDPRGEK
eukprot:scaffold8374_cov175-Amphora_coffeaeformis.AAC.121